MLISHKHKFIFIKNTKTGSSSIQTLLGKYCWPDDVEYHYVDHDFIPFKGVVKDDKIREDFDKYKENKNGIIGTGAGTKWTSHLTAAEIKEYIGEEIFDKYFKFAVVRNPYNKVLSKYFWDMHDHKGESIKSWLLKGRNACNLIHHVLPRSIKDGKPCCDFYVKYENMKEDLGKACEIIGIPDVDFSKLPKNKDLNKESDLNCMEKYGIKDMFLKYKSSPDAWREIYTSEEKEMVLKRHEREFDFFNYEK